MRYASLDPDPRAGPRARRSGRRLELSRGRVRSRNLTYVGEIPFPYTSETDRVLVFADLLFDALAPGTRERHRALVRLEDIDPRATPRELRAAADYLHCEGIPFGFGVIPRYRDPTGTEKTASRTTSCCATRPSVVAAIKYMQRKGGVLVGHGYTHQWDGGREPLQRRRPATTWSSTA